MLTCINALLILPTALPIRGELRTRYLPNEQSHQTGKFHEDGPQ